MREVLQALLIVGLVTWVSCLVAVLWVRSRVRRRLRIDPAVRSAAPTVWVVVPTAPARLHRRLRVAATTARMASTCDQGLALLADDLVSEARALEPRVLAVAGTGRAGASVRRDLAARVSELEMVARRIAVLANEPASETGGSIRMRDRVTALEAARQELDEIDLRAGVLRHA